MACCIFAGVVDDKNYIKGVVATLPGELVGDELIDGVWRKRLNTASWQYATVDGSGNLEIKGPPGGVAVANVRWIPS